MMHQARLHQQDNQVIFWYSEQKGTQGKKTYASVSLNSKALLMISQRVPTKSCTTSSLFPPLFPTAFYTFLNNDEYWNSGSSIAHNHRSRLIEVGYIECLCQLFYSDSIFFSQTNYTSKISQHKTSLIIQSVSMHFTRILYHQSHIEEHSSMQILKLGIMQNSSFIFHSLGVSPIPMERYKQLFLKE